MSYTSAIVLAAGEGVRFSRSNSFRVRGETKPLAGINSKPVIIHCLNTLSRHPGIRDIILVVNSKNLKGIIRKTRQYRIAKIKDVVLGGRLRQDSVINGLKALNPRTDLVLIHDGVRPFVDKDIISSAIRAAKNYGAAIVGVPVKATIKRVHGSGFTVHGNFIVKETLDRKDLWEIQTPQVFKKGLLLEAYKRFGNKEVTDDAALVEKLGAQVRVVKGTYLNIKITTPEDLVLAEAISNLIS